MVQIIAVIVLVAGVVSFVGVGWHKYNSAIESRVATEAVLKTCETNYGATLRQVESQNTSLQQLSNERDAAKELAEKKSAEAKAEAAKNKPERDRLAALAMTFKATGNCPAGEAVLEVRKGLRK